jgi:hypothetical protein
VRKIKNKLILSIMILIIILSACNKNKNNEIKSEIITDTEFEECNCPVCDICEKKTTVSIDPFEMSKDYDDIISKNNIEKVTLLKLKESIMSSEKIEFVFSDSKIDGIENVIFNFTPNCNENSNKMILEFNKKKIFEESIICKSSESIKIDIENVKRGINTIKIIANVKDDLIISEIALTTNYFESETFNQYSKDIFMDPAEEDETFHTFSNYDLTNYKELTIDLDDDEILEDYVLEFDSEIIKGTIYVYINKELIFDRDIKKENSIIIPKEKLKGGKNIITIVSVGN